MRYKVELHPDVNWFVRHECTERERRLFYETLDHVRSEPLGYSEFTVEPELSRYALRRFRFGSNLAVFKFDPARGRIWILKCRKLKPKHRSAGGGERDAVNGP